jgi:hypothetical protein
MDWKTGCEILEIEPGATIPEMRQAYRDLVNVWHPDRFAHNPRLRKKAEEKLKEINQAYRFLRGTTSETWEREASAAREEGNGEAAEAPTAKGPTDGTPATLASIFRKIRERCFRGAARFGSWPAFRLRLRRLRRVLGIAVLVSGLVFLASVFLRPKDDPPKPSRPAARVSVSPETEPDAFSGSVEWPEWLVRLQERLEWWDSRTASDAPAPPSPSAKPRRSVSAAPADDRAADAPTEDDWPSLVPPDMNLPPLRRSPRGPAATPAPSAKPIPHRPRIAEEPPPDPALAPAVIRERARLADLLHVRADRYLDRGDGTVLDSRTGRIWARDNSFLETGRFLSYGEAARYVRSLDIGGFRDWRLPRSDELAEIYLNGTRFPAGGSHLFWSSEVYARGWHQVVRVIRPESERVHFAYPSERGAVHAVRP